MARTSNKHASKSREVSIKRTEMYGGRTFYEIAAEHGLLVAVRTHTTGELALLDIETDADFTKQGIGKRLARAALDVAIEDSARVVRATIISRECVHIMQSVFGEEAVTIKELGLFGAEDGLSRGAADAKLWYEVPQPD